MAGRIQQWSCKLGRFIRHIHKSRSITNSAALKKENLLPVTSAIKRKPSSVVITNY